MKPPAKTVADHGVDGRRLCRDPLENRGCVALGTSIIARLDCIAVRRQDRCVVCVAVPLKCST